jgi:hypothetical protein
MQADSCACCCGLFGKNLGGFPCPAWMKAARAKIHPPSHVIG